MKTCNVCNKEKPDSDFERETVWQCKRCRMDRKTELRIARAIREGRVYTQKRKVNSIEKPKTIYTNIPGWEVYAFFWVLRYYPVEFCRWILPDKKPNQTVNVPLVKICPQCSNPFLGQRMFCSGKCYSDSGNVTRPCSFCGKMFTVNKSDSRVKCCSRECGYSATRRDTLLDPTRPARLIAAKRRNHQISHAKFRAEKASRRFFQMLLLTSVIKKQTTKENTHE